MKNVRRDVNPCLAAALFAVAGFALPVLATGPDVIVGDMPDTTHWGSGTNTNGVVVEAYSVGTTSCNIGDAPLQWLTGSNSNIPNRHPVIGQNMYRLDVSKGRFEQIGQSWLKHGFTALQGTVCFSNCQAYSNGSYLGVRCSDPYGSGLNGSQSGLGTKAEVNASIGLYPIPYGAGSQGTSSSTVFKRLQVLRTDLQTPNALYFVSGQYVTGDDAEAGNHNNNESYRRVTVNQSSFDLQLQDTTQREKAAIYAWRDHGLGANTPDAGVLINNANVAGDGRFIIGSKVIDLGGGNYRYEYAIENLNSDRSGGSFSVPLPANAVMVTSGPNAPFFRDVPYHSGDPFNGTDWTWSVSANAITFNVAQTYAQNVNANALRWGTTYSFAFVCNIPPAGGNTTIGLFKPATAISPATSVLAAAFIPSSDGQFHPLNDSCAGATAIGAGTTNFSNVNSSTDGPAECNLNGSSQIENDVWFTYTNQGTCTNPMTISTCGSGFNTKLAVYTQCPTGPGTAIACSDDAPSACGTGTTSSSVTFNPAANTTYLLRVGGFLGATGSGVLNVTAPFCPPPPGPANDAQANAQPLADNVPFSGTLRATANTLAATNDGTSSCGNSSSAPDVWFTYRPLVTGTVAIDTCESRTNNVTSDTVIDIFTGSPGQLTAISGACNDDNGNQGPCRSQSATSYRTLTMTAGTTYYIRLAGYNGSLIDYRVRAVGGGGVLPPANDTCATAQTISAPATAFSTVGANTDGPAHTGCNFNGSNQISSDVWFNYTAPAAGTLTVDTCNAATNFNTKLAIYTDALCLNYDARLIACSDDDAACGSGRSNATAQVNAGQTYKIRVGGFNGASGAGLLNVGVTPIISCEPDANQDGNADQGDVDYLINIIAGGANPTGIDADFNQDGNSDQGDIDSLVNVIAGGDCP